jgi:signal transduction histidine kinase
MLRSRASNYNFILLNLASFLTLAVVAYEVLSDMTDGRTRWIGASLFAGFGVLLFFYLYTEHKPILVHAYLIAQLALIMSIYALDPVAGLGIVILFFILSAQAMLFLPMVVGIGWIIVFTLAALWGLVNVHGLGAVLHELTLVGGFSFFGAFGAMLRRADAARRQSDHLLKELQTAHEQLREYAAQTHQLAVAEERNRLARELHDSLGHRLTVAVVQLEGAQRLIPTEPARAAQMIGSMRTQIKDALGELRQSLAALRQPAQGEIDNGLAPLNTAVTRLAQTFQEATGLVIHLNLPDTFPSLPDSHRLALYRAAQEMLTNVQRHAGATEAWITIGLTGAQITLTVEDNGQGILDDIPGGRFGIKGLHERASRLEGQLHITNRPSGGVQAQFCLPLAER